MFAGVKSSLKSLLPPSDDERKRKAYVNRLGTAVLVVITAIAINCGEEDVSTVLGIVGSILGCSVAYVIPGSLALIHQRARKRNGLKNSGKEVLYNHLLVVVGAVFGLFGVWACYSS